MMKSTFIRSLALLLALTFGSSPCALAEIGLEKTHGDWTSFAVTEGKQIRFRAMSQCESKGFKSSVICFDRFADDPEYLYMTLNIGTKKPVRQTLRREDAPIMDAMIRMDEFPLHEVKYNIESTRGEHVYIVNFSEYENRRFIREIFSSDVIRFKLGTDDTDFYLRFSLSGLREATDRTRLLAREFNEFSRKQHDSSYFEDELDDSQYFEKYQ